MTARSSDPTLANIRDSVFHGLHHFSEWEQLHTDSYHHEKWATLSIHHAVEMYLKTRLEEIDPTNQVFQKTFKGRKWHPSAKDVISELDALRSKITLPEQYLIDFAIELTAIRDTLMHDAKGSVTDFSVAAWAALAVLKSLSRHYKIAAKDIFEQYPPIEKTIFNALKWEHHSTYIHFVEESLKEEYPAGTYFHYCTLCGAQAVMEGSCGGCFEEMELMKCVSCGEEFTSPTSPEKMGIDEVSCPSCDSSQRQMG